MAAVNEKHVISRGLRGGQCHAGIPKYESVTIGKPVLHSIARLCYPRVSANVIRHNIDMWKSCKG